MNMEVIKDKYSRALKVVLIGDGGTGKTSLVNQFVHKSFNTIYKTTIGVDITPYLVAETKDPKKTIRFVLWDMSGQSHFERFRTRFYAGTSGALVVYDLTSANSYRNVERWINELYSKCKDVPIVIAGNKADISELQIKHSRPPTLEHSHLTTSAKTNQNVEKAFFTLFEKIANKELTMTDSQDSKTTHVSYESEV